MGDFSPKLGGTFYADIMGSFHRFFSSHLEDETNRWEYVHLTRNAVPKVDLKFAQFTWKMVLNQWNTSGILGGAALLG